MPRQHTDAQKNGSVAKFFEIRDNARFLFIINLMISFKGAHFPKEFILYAAFFHGRYGVSYRDLEEIMDELGVNVDQATLNRWVIDYSSLIRRYPKNASVPAPSRQVDEN